MEDTPKEIILQARDKKYFVFSFLSLEHNRDGGADDFVGCFGSIKKAESEIIKRLIPSDSYTPCDDRGHIFDIETKAIVGRYMFDYDTGKIEID